MPSDHRLRPFNPDVVAALTGRTSAAIETMARALARATIVSRSAGAELGLKVEVPAPRGP